MGLAAQSHCQWPGRLREAGPPGDSVCGLLGASSAPPGWNPCRGAPGEEQAAGFYALRAPWGRVARCWPSSGAYGCMWPGCRDRGTPPGTPVPGAQATVLQTHTARSPAGRPGHTGTCPTAPRQLLSSPPLGRHPGLWVTGGVRWRSLTPEHHGSDAETSPSNPAQLRSYIKKWGF